MNKKNYPWKTWEWNEYLARNKAENIIERDGVNTLDNVPLLSFSTFTQWAQKINLYGIPEHNLENARNVGKLFMETLYDIWYNKADLTKYEFPSEQIRLMILSFLNTLAENQLKIIDVERHITNGRWHGYVDVVVRHVKTSFINFIEIKTRSDNKMKPLDKLQVAVYNRIVGNNVASSYVAVINKKTFETTLYRTREVLKPLRALDNLLVAMGKEEYTLAPKD